MRRVVLAIIALLMLALPRVALAEPADIDAAARGVVRVVIIGSDGREIYPVSHGTGFAVSNDVIVTNAHVVRDAINDDRLQIGIVPTGGGEAVYGELIATSPTNDLALVRITGDLRLPPLALAGGPPPESGQVVSVGYPMNVDRAQGLEIGDIFRSQPPVTSRGFVSGSRPSRQFDTILHTAPIARGNSGGPLLDECGRVVGVNSFGADADGADGEFYFAVSNRELIPFLREAGIAARINQQPCRSLADLNEAEQERLEREQMEARQNLAQRSEEQRTQRARAQLEAEETVQTEREDRMALALVLLLAAFGLGQWALAIRADPAHDPRKLRIVAAGAAVCVLAAIVIYITRPGLAEIDRRVANAMQQPAEGSGEPGEAAAELALTCRLVPERSRITSAEVQDLSFEWSADGCVNGRTQYGFSAGTWSRVFVPNEEDAVSVSSFDPDRRIFRTERYLLGRSAMADARAARAKYEAPACSAEGAAAQLGDLQGEVLALLPRQPNERLVYECSETGG